MIQGIYAIGLMDPTKNRLYQTAQGRVRCGIERMPLPTEQEIDLEARLVAIESLVTQIGVAAVLTVSDADIKQAHDHVRQKLQDLTFPSKIDPALKDHFVALIAEHTDRLLGDIESKVKQVRAAQRRAQ